MKYKKFLKLDPKEVYWNFQHNSSPYFSIQSLFKSYPDSINIDPFPCSTHNMDLLKKHVTEVESKFKIHAPVRWIILPFETTCHTNATAYHYAIYNDKKPKLKERYCFEGFVAMSGKRTIVHPAMTRYLAGHEYGHMVDYWITAQMNKGKEHANENTFRRLYAEMRGLPFGGGYGGGRWIDNIGEIIADDFRIAVAGIDEDFYEHTCTHPLKSKKVIAFWKEMHKKYAVK